MLVPNEDSLYISAAGFVVINRLSDGALVFGPRYMDSQYIAVYLSILFCGHSKSDATTFSNMLFTAASLLFFGQASASPLSSRQTSCPAIHVFGARETTVSPGYGTAGVVVNLILNAYPGATSEAIVYPACGGQASCGSISYANSVQQGVAAVAAAVNAFNTKCPSTQLVLVGYSQVSCLPHNTCS